MAFIDSSAPQSSGLAAAVPGDLEDDDELEPIAEENEEAAGPAMERTWKPGSLAEDLIQQIEDVNLARYIEPQELDRIGMECVREYEIDEISRKDWLDKTI